MLKNKMKKTDLRNDNVYNGLFSDDFSTDCVCSD